MTPMTAPSGSQQEKLLHRVYDKFQVDVDQLDYIEAHGNSLSTKKSFYMSVLLPMSVSTCATSPRAHLHVVGMLRFLSLT